MAYEPGRRPPWAAVLIFALLGGVLAAQFNLQRHMAVGQRVEEARLDQVLALYVDQKHENRRLVQRIEELNHQLQELKRQEASGPRLETVQRELDTARRCAGLAALQGPGVRVVLKDSSSPVETELDQSAYTVHDQDLLLVVNELWAAKAEAISINGQRLVATSEVRCTGPVIQVNSVAVAAPYEMLAIGDPDALSGALADLRGGIVDQLQSAGIEVRITREKNLVVPAWAHEPSYRYARPAPAPTRTVPGSEGG